MRLVLHILKKDLRRLWLEILISLGLLGVYVWVTLQGPDNQSAFVFSWVHPTGQSISLLLLAFWIFLTVRVVQGETLVGDRQWWVTKPYEWWELLAAKQLFLLVCFNLPLLLVQLFLLHHAGFAISHHLFGVLIMQFELVFTLFLPAVALGCLTKGLGQALLGVILVVVAFWGTFALLAKIPDSEMASAVPSGDNLATILIPVSIVAAIAWQYARRRTWPARGLIASCAAIVLLLCALAPYGKFVDQKYPLVNASEAPANFALVPSKPNTKTRNGPFDFMPELFLRIPISAADVPEGQMVLLEGFKLSIETGSGTKWSSGWKSQWLQFWHGDVNNALQYSVERKSFERVKNENARVHLELALTEYLAGEARDLVLRGGEFSDPQLGICRLSADAPSQIDCRRPFHPAAFMATFDPTTAACHMEDPEDSRTEKVSHAWSAPHDDSPDTGLDPVQDFAASFGSDSRFYVRLDKKFKPAHLCPGAVVKLAVPHQMRHLRVVIDLDNVKLQDLVRSGLDSD